MWQHQGEREFREVLLVKLYTSAAMMEEIAKSINHMDKVNNSILVTRYF
jgi:hypothetical protein